MKAKIKDIAEILKWGLEISLAIIFLPLTIFSSLILEKVTLKEFLEDLDNI